MKRILLVSHLTLLIVLHLQPAAAQGFRLETRWSVPPGERAYITTGSNQRGLAYNPLSGNLILVNRAGGLSVWVLEATTGNELWTLDTTGISGGTFVLSKVAVADDGAIYAANFGTIGGATPTFNVYRWAGEFEGPTLAYSGDPGAGNIQQWGTTLDVRGSDIGTQIIISSSGGTIAAILNTSDGANFFSTLLQTDVLPGQMGIAVAFGTNDTFWAKSAGGPLLHLSFDLAAGTATTLRTFDVTNFPGTVGPLAVEATNNLLGAINITTPDVVNLYSLANLSPGPVLLSSTNTPTDNDNALFMGAVDFGGGMMFALDSNNGLIAYNIVPSSDPVPPSIVLQPAPATVFAGSTATLVSSAAGTAPLRYQWHGAAGPILNATNPVLTITNVQAADEGLYSVVVTNVAGTVTSFSAQLTVLPPGVLTPLWNLPPGSRSYLTSSGNNQRGLAYNPVTDHLILVNRAGGLTVNVIDATTGTNVGTMITTDISGGTFVLSKIEVAEDGAIYGANFGSFPSTVFTIYRWADESAAPTIAFRGDPANGTGNQQYGNSFALRGGGANTQILVPTQRDVVAFLTTADGATFVSTPITGVPGGGAYNGVAFGAGDTFWGKTNGSPLVHVSFDPATGASTLLQSFDSSVFPGPVGPLAVDPTHNLLAAISIATPDTIQIYDLTSPADPPVLMQTVKTPADNANTLFQGAIDFGGGKLFALDTNNGLSAYLLPLLKVNLVDGKVVVSWPVALTGFTLESRSSLSSGNWTAMSGAVVVGDQQALTLTAPPGNQFFRLRK